MDLILPGAPSWRLVGTLAIAQLVAWGSLTYSFSLLVGPMEAELGWTRTTLNGALSLGLLVSGLLAYSIGGIIDRHGGRLVMTLGSVLGATMLAAWSMVDSIPAFYLVWLGLGVAMATNLYEPAFAVLTRLFPTSFRTKITAITLIGGFASTIFIPLTQTLIEQYGWRHTLRLLALILALVGPAIHALALRHDGKGIRPITKTSPADSRAIVRRAMATRAFWGLGICFTAYYGILNAMIFHMVPILTERGFSTGQMIGAIALIGPAQVAGRVALLIRRRRSEEFGLWVLGVFVAAILLLVLGENSLITLYAFAILFGAANGIMTILRGTAIPDLLWTEGYGAINGALSLPAMAAKAAGPFAAALIWKAGGSYDSLLWTVIGGGIVAGIGFKMAISKSA